MRPEGHRADPAGRAWPARPPRRGVVTPRADTSDKVLIVGNSEGAEAALQVAPREHAWLVGHGRQRPVYRALYLSLVASVFVPAAHATPPAFEYIDRSTTICTGVSPRLSMTHANCLSVTAVDPNSAGGQTRRARSTAADRGIDRRAGGSARCSSSRGCPTSALDVLRRRSGPSAACAASCWGRPTSWPV